MRYVAAVALVALLAGCASSGTTTSSGPTPQPMNAKPFTMQNDVGGCTEDVGLLLVAPADAQRLLPAGWIAADARAFLGTPVDTGQGLLWLNGYSCATSTLGGPDLSGAEISVLVNAPTLVNGTVPSSSFHTYELTHVTSNATFATLLRSIGLPTIVGTVTNDAPLPGGMVNRGVQVHAGTDVLYSVRFLGTPNQPLTGTATFWHESGNGTMYTRYETSNTPLDEGYVTACAIGPLVAALIQQTTCPATTLGARATTATFTGTLAWMPGAHTAK